MKHKCIKCTAEYSDNDPDDYLCLKCRGAKAEIAAQIDSNFVPRPKAPTMLEQYDNAKKVNGRFPRLSDV